MKKNVIILLLLGIAFGLYSCGDDDVDKSISVFEDEDPRDPSSITYDFDEWLDKTFLNPYNVEFRYKFIDVNADIDYNFVPAILDRSQELAILVNYLWFDVYSSVVSEDFLKENGPRIISLVGSAATNPNSGTKITGLAEGGIKVTLFEVNDLDVTNITQSKLNDLNEKYFHVMHHEFSHILHQKKMYPREFEDYTAGYYDPQNWRNRTNSEAYSVGCVTPYGMSQAREDFAEIIACYIMRSDEWWDDVLTKAKEQGRNSSGDLVDDNVEGDVALKAKIQMCKEWIQDAWGVNLEAVRDEVRERQLHVKEILEQEYW